MLSRSRLCAAIPALRLNWRVSLNLGEVRKHELTFRSALAGNLTRWGYGDCTATLNNGAFGAMLPKRMSSTWPSFINYLTSRKVLQRNLSRNYAYDNIYTLFPLTCPEDTKRLLALELPNPEDLKMYDFERPKLRHIVSVETKAAISYVFNSPNFQTIYEKDLKTLTSGHG